MNAHSQARLAELAPQVRDLWTKVDAMLSAEGIDAEIVQGGRSFNLQDALYAQGREPLDQVNAKRTSVGLAAIAEAENSKPVTWAKSGDSWHNFYMALDCVPFSSGAAPIWDVAAPEFIRMIAIAKSVGFTCGIDWPGQKKDSDHFQFTGTFGVNPNGEAQFLFTEGGVEAVWKAAYGGGA